MYAIQTTGLEKHFRRKRVLRGVSMHVARGDIYGFIGKNGSGKSTTMKIIAGLMPPSAGEVSVLGTPLVPCGPHPQVGTLIENPGIYSTLSAIDNMMVKALALGVVDARTSCRLLLKMVGLDADSKQKAKRFSMGMKQRLGLALALLGDPDVLLLDEPLNGLDPEATRDMRNLIMRLARERNVTVLISSHVIDQLERMCTRYGIIRDGVLVRELSAAEVDEACRGHLMLRCTEPARALAVLSEQCPAFSITAMPDDALRIVGEADTARIGQILMGAGIAVTDMHRTEGDVEAFFVQLMDGKDVDEEDGGASPAGAGSAAAGGAAAASARGAAQGGKRWKGGA